MLAGLVLNPATGYMYMICIKKKPEFLRNIIPRPLKVLSTTWEWINPHDCVSIRVSARCWSRWPTPAWKFFASLNSRECLTPGVWLCPTVQCKGINVYIGPPQRWSISCIHMYSGSRHTSVPSRAKSWSPCKLQIAKSNPSSSTLPASNVVRSNNKNYTYLVLSQSIAS